MLTCCALQLLFGRLFTCFSVRKLLFSNVLTFEAASALCGGAPSSRAFIIGRAIAGIGAAGIFAGAVCLSSLNPPLLADTCSQMTSMIHVVPTHHRPKVFGCMGGMMAISQICGPLIGGVFTTNVSWGWCFYVDLPIGGVAMVCILLFLHIPEQVPGKLPLKQKLAGLDFPGTILVAIGAICVLLALQWGGHTYAVSSPAWRLLLTQLTVYSGVMDA